MLDRERWQEAVGRAGFVLGGPAPPRVEERDRDRLAAWSDAGCQGEMAWLSRTAPLRVDPKAFLPGARSVLVVGLPTARESFLLAGGGRVAAYAVGRDYHRFMGKRLERLARCLELPPAARGTLYRPALDIHPVLERALAAGAGLGWQGGQAQLIHPDHGPWLLLGELFLVEGLEPAPAASLPGCGSCRRCIQACPTGAITAPGLVDARRCISYLTIEARGLPPRPLRKVMGDRLFGCDECLTACPWGGDAPGGGDPDLAPHPALTTLNLGDFLELTPDRFDRLLRGTPLRRAGREGLVRNAAIVAANLGRQDLLPSLGRLLGESSPLLRGAAAWSLGRLGSSRPLLEKALAAEDVAWVREEIEQALAG